MKLIVVDDESDVQILFMQRFRREIKTGEMEIQFALNGRSALKLLESLEDRNNYHVLTDINMPEMTGIELLREIKERYPDLKVIVITAYGDAQNFDNAKKFGAEDYFTKPLEFDVLKAKLNYLEELKG